MTAPFCECGTPISPRSVSHLGVGIRRLIERGILSDTKQGFTLA